MQIDAVSRRPQSITWSVLASYSWLPVSWRGEGGLHYEHRGTRFIYRIDEQHDRNKARRCVKRHRHGCRVVRFSGLRHGNRSRLQQAVFSTVRSGTRHHSRFRHLRRRLSRPAFGRRYLWTFWRPGRPQGDAGDDHYHHGAWHVPDRPSSHLRPDRHRRTYPACPPASASGHRHRRRMGRSCADGRRECAGQKPRTSRVDGSDWLADRESRRNRHICGALAGA